MVRVKKRIPALPAIAAFCLLVQLLAACSSIKVVEWTEDTRLADGRVITVKRTQEFQRVSDAGAGFQSGWLFTKSSISARLPSPANRHVEWEGALVPMLIDMLPGGAPVLVGRAPTGAAVSEWKTPRGKPQVALVLDGTWQRVALDMVPTSYRANLLGATHELFITGNGKSGMHLKQEKKQQINSDSSIGPSAREIVR